MSHQITSLGGEREKEIPSSGRVVVLDKPKRTWAKGGGDNDVTMAGEKESARPPKNKEGNVFKKETIGTGGRTSLTYRSKGRPG